jgi:hypothetical protein
MFVEPRRIGRTCSLFDAFALLGHGGSSEAECTSSNGQPAPPASTQQLATHAIDEVALVSDIDSRLLTDRGQNRTELRRCVRAFTWWRWALRRQSRC